MNDDTGHEPTETDTAAEIAQVIRDHTAATRDMTDALLADQRAGREEQARRFEAMREEMNTRADEQARRLDRQDRKLTWLRKVSTGLAVALALALVLLAVLVVANHLDSVNRDEQAAQEQAQRDALSKRATEQRDCGDGIQNVTLGRLVDLAAVARFRTDPAGNVITDERGIPVPLPPEEAGRKLAELLRGVTQASQALQHSHDLCYGPDGPSSDPLGQAARTSPGTTVPTTTR